MKYLGVAKKILGTEIRRERALGRLWLSRVPMLERCWRGLAWRNENQ